MHEKSRRESPRVGHPSWPLVLIGALLMVAPASAGELTIFGLDHSTVGNAQFDVDEQGGLVVSNLGPGGQDGYRVEVGETLGVIPDLELPSTSMPVGSWMQGETRGRVNGLDDQPTGTLRVEGVASGSQITPDFSAIGADTYTLIVVNEGQVVYQRSGMSGVAGIAQATAAKRKVCCRVIRYSIPIGRAASFQTADGLTFTADNVFFDPEGPTRQVDFISSLTVRIAGIPQMVVRGTLISVFDSFLEHYALGDVVLTAADGDLAVSGIDSTGTEGVAVDIAYPLAETLGWQLESSDVLDPAALPTGPISSVEVRGTIAGEEGALASRATIEDIGNSLRVNADFSSVGATTRTIQLFHQGQMVAQVTGYSGPGVEIDSPLGIRQEVYKYRRDGTVKKCVITTTSAVQARIGGFTGLVDSIEQLPEGPVASVILSTAEIRGSASPSLTITHEAYDVEAEGFSDNFESGDVSSWSRSEAGQ